MTRQKPGTATDPAGKEKPSRLDEHGRGEGWGESLVGEIRRMAQRLFTATPEKLAGFCSGFAAQRRTPMEPSA